MHETSLRDPEKDCVIESLSVKVADMFWVSLLLLGKGSHVFLSLWNYGRGSQSPPTVEFSEHRILSQSYYLSPTVCGTLDFGLRESQVWEIDLLSMLTVKWKKEKMVGCLGQSVFFWRGKGCMMSTSFRPHDVPLNPTQKFYEKRQRNLAERNERSLWMATG